MSSRDEQQEEYNLLRIEALEGRVRELEIELKLENENKRIIVTELEIHLNNALEQGYQIKA